MNSLFNTRALIGAVNRIKPVPTLILDRVFSQKSRQLTDRFFWDVLTQSEEILANLRVGEPAQLADNQGMKTITCEAPRFSEKRLISAADLNGMRGFGQQSGVQLLSERLGANLAEMRRKIDLTREFMAARCLAGQVVDKNGVVLVDYMFTAAQKPTLPAGELWTAAGSSPLNTLRALKKQVGQAAGNVNRFVAFVGTAAMDALVTNASAVELLKYSHGKELVESGRIANIAGVELVEYMGSYIDSNATRQDLIPVDRLVLVGLTGDHAAELTAPVVDLESSNGVGMGRPGEFFFSKSWEEKDPSGRWVKVEARPLPVLKRPECIVYAKVV